METRVERDMRGLELAIENEVAGYEFYTEAAEATADPTGQKMFRTLARDEEVHWQTLEAERKSLLEKGLWQSHLTGRPIPTVEERPVFPKTVEGQVTASTHELEALKVGIEMERKSQELYRRLAEETDDPDGKALYRYLIEFEVAHQLILEAEYDHLTRSGFWFGFQEFDLEE